MKIKMIILAACMALLASCSSGPSESVMKSQIEESYNKLFNVEFVKLENFDKTNGRESGEDYLADLTYDLEFTKSATELVKEFSKKSGMGLREAAMTIRTITGMSGKFKPGDTKHMDVKGLKFAESENGWVISK